MPDSPASATPYEVLGVDPAASQDALRRAYRRLARETHPDLGGNAERFRQVQLAWELVGSVDDRARYDRGSAPRREQAAEPQTWAPAPPRRRPESKPRARTFGHPGGVAREAYLELLHEWVGRGTAVDDPYDAALVRSAPPEIRRLLAKALAEEATAASTADLGIAYTVWNDVAAGAEAKLDHIVLAPSGLYAVRSDDFGVAVRPVKGELEAAEGAAPLDEQPVRALTRSARAFAKASRVPFTALLVVVPDDAAADPVEAIGKGRRNSAYLVQRSVLPYLLQQGLDPDAARLDVFEVRDRLQRAARFV